MTKSDIKLLIQQGNLRDAIDNFIICAKGTRFHNPIIQQSTRFNNNENENNMGILSRSDYNRTKSQIAYVLLEYLDQISDDEFTSTSSPSNLKSNSMQDKLKEMQALKRKVMFGYSTNLKNDVNLIIQELSEYVNNKTADSFGTFDVDERIEDRLNQTYNDLKAAYDRELRTKQARQVADIKQKLIVLESDFNKDNATVLTKALIGYDAQYKHLNESLNQMDGESDLENFAMQLVDIVFAL